MTPLPLVLLLTALTGLEVFHSNRAIADEAFSPVISGEENDEAEARDIPDEEPHPVIESIQGAKTLTVIYSGRKYQLSMGQEIQYNSRLQTGPASSAVIRYPDGSKAVVSVGSDFTIEDYIKGTQWNRLKKGRVRGLITKPPVSLTSSKPRFLIRTKAAVLGVRGTDFVMTVHPETNATQVHTLEGSVNVAKDQVGVLGGEGTSVTEGKFVETSSSGISSPQTFNKEQFLKEFNAEAAGSGPGSSGPASVAPSSAIEGPAAEPSSAPVTSDALTAPRPPVVKDASHPEVTSFKGEAEEAKGKPPSHQTPSSERGRFSLLNFQAGVFFAEINPDGLTKSKDLSPLVESPIRSAHLAWTPTLPVPIISILSLRGLLGVDIAQNGSLQSQFLVLEYQAFLSLSLFDFIFAEAGGGLQSWRSPMTFDSRVMTVNAGIYLGTGLLDRAFISYSRMDAQPFYSEFRAGIGIAF